MHIHTLNVFDETKYFSKVISISLSPQLSIKILCDYSSLCAHSDRIEAMRVKIWRFNFSQNEVGPRKQRKCIPLKISRYMVVQLQQLKCVHLSTYNCGDHKLKLTKRQKPVGFSFMHGSDAERERK